MIAALLVIGMNETTVYVVVYVKYLVYQAATALIPNKTEEITHSLHWSVLDWRI